VADAKALGQLALDGLERVRADAARWPGVNPVAGWLQASTVEAGDELIARLQILGSDFGVAIEGWQVEQVRAVLRSERYFHAIHYPTAFAVHARNYAHGLAAEATRLGVRLFANTPVTAIDAAGIRKRVDTPFGRIRASYIVLAGNVHLGSAAPRLGATLLPVWRSVGVTAPLGDKLAEVIAYSGAVTEAGDADRYRIVDGNRLMWAGPPTTFQPSPAQARRRLAKRVAAAFPQFGAVAFDHVWSGVYGQTVHGMPQIGELRPGLWVASGFGPQGLNTTAMAGELVVSGMLAKDDRWRLFSPFELVWAGGSSGRVVGQAIFSWIRGRTAVAGRLSRHHEQARRKEQERERRLEAANQAARMARPPGDAGGDSATPQ
jgi:2Fe-2S ferredoxin